MLVIQTLRFARRLPVLMLLGLAVMAAGGTLDIVVHGFGLAHAAHDHAHDFGIEHLAHLVGIAGMVLVLAGLVMRGARHQRRLPAPQPQTRGGLDSHAHR